MDLYVKSLPGKYRRPEQKHVSYIQETASRSVALVQRARRGVQGDERNSEKCQGNIPDRNLKTISNFDPDGKNTGGVVSHEAI